MTFDELKPGAFVVPVSGIKSWAIIKHKQSDKVIIDDYWLGISGYFNKRCDTTVKKDKWNDTVQHRLFKYADSKDAQDLIVMIFARA